MPDTASTSIAPTFNADLYALGFLAAAATPTVADAENYWYFGNTPQASLPGTAGAAPISGSVDRIIDDFLVPTDFVANGGTETLKTGDISSYIQSLYSDPVGNGFTPGSSYLVVRVTPDADSAPTVGTQRYSLSNQGVVNPNGENRPTITLNTEVVPEPSCFVLLCMGLCGLIVRRRVG